MRKAARIIGIVFLIAALPFPIISLNQDEGRGGPFGSRWAIGSSSINNKPLPKTEEEKRILGVLENMMRKGRRMESVPIEDGKLLRLLTEAVGAKIAVEISTSQGYSGLCICVGLQATGGKLITHEIDPYRTSLAREHFKQAGVDKIVTIVEGDAHKEVIKLKGPINILFIDADKEGYLDYLTKLLPLIRPGGLILSHNMNFPRPDPAYIKAITTNPNLETIFLHMHSAGMGVTLKKR
jgi:caffeoyl-CoA O-methyltransferase